MCPHGLLRVNRIVTCLQMCMCCLSVCMCAHGYVYVCVMGEMGAGEGFLSFEILN